MVNAAPVVDPDYFKQFNQYEAKGRTVAISDKDFEQLRDFIYNISGMYFHATKKYFLESRLTRRMEAVGVKTHQDYYQLLKSSRGTGE